MPQRAAALLGLWLTLWTAVAAAQPQGQPQSLPVDRTPLVIQTDTGLVSFRVEIARTDRQKNRGLMFRTDLPPTQGMLFVWNEAALRTFWMRDTPLALDLIFIGPDRRIVSIAKNTTPFSEAHIPSVRPAQWVLEINAGLADIRRLRPGQPVRHPALGN